jgi:hypothetical protein
MAHTTYPSTLAKLVLKLLERSYPCVLLAVRRRPST